MDITLNLRFGNEMQKMAPFQLRSFNGESHQTWLTWLTNVEQACVLEGKFVLCSLSHFSLPRIPPILGLHTSRFGHWIES